MLFDSKVEQGQIAEKEVKQKLWRFNYSVKSQVFKKRRDYSRPTQDFDLLIEESIRVEVKSTAMSKKGYWNFMVNNRYLAFVDYYAFVFIYPDKTTRIRFLDIKTVKDKMARYSISFKSPDDEVLIKSPYKAFGKPKSLSTQNA